MDRNDVLFERWAELQCEADMAILAYDGGEREEGREQLEEIWKCFQKELGCREERMGLEDAYQETMNMVLERLYWDYEEAGDEAKLWQFCQEVCRELSSEEAELEEYASCLGRLMQKRGQIRECDAWFARCCEENPDSPIYRAEWARCWLQRGEREQAENLLEQGMSIAPKCRYDTLHFYQVAVGLYRVLQREDAAEHCLQKIAELDEELLELEAEE